jgi:hypothetical protein
MRLLEANFDGVFPHFILRIEVAKLIQKIEPMLYTDIQSEVPKSLCPVCGGARYAPGEHCLRCERGKL